MRKQLKGAIAATLIGGWLWSSQAWAGAATNNVYVKGDVVFPPCVVNSDAPMTIDFGDVPVTGPTGPDDSLLQTKTVNVSCQYYQGTPYVTITGPIMGGALGCLATNIADFCIEFYYGSDRGSWIRLNSKNAVTKGMSGQNTPNGTFTFSVAPYRDKVPLTAGTFTATATMSFVYD